MHYSSGLRHWGFQLLGFYCKCFESRLSGREVREVGMEVVV